MNPFSCCVCVNPEATKNSFFKCESCGVCIHALCYGIDIDLETSDNWLCSPCKMGIHQPSCELCLQTTGAFKKTSCEKWVHVICALFTEGVIIEDKNDMEPVNLSEVSETKRNQTCAYCLKDVGFCCLCSKSKCSKRIHITCAQQNDCTIEVVNKEKDSIKFRAYCSDHKPNKSKHRVSSEFVREIVAKKSAKEHKMKHTQNADWILMASTENSVLKDVQNAVSDIINANGKRPAERYIPSPSNTVAKKSKALATHVEKENLAPNQLNVQEKEPVDINKPGISNAACHETNQSSKTIQDHYESENSVSESMLWDSCGGKLDVSLGFVEIEHECYKDEEIKKLKEKNRSLKNQSNQLQQLNSDLQQKMLYSTKAEVDNSLLTNKNDKGMKSLLKNITPQICDDDKSKMVYPNGVKAVAKQLKYLDTISSTQLFDRSFINSSFMIFFSEKYIRKQKKKGLDRKTMLNKFRDSNRYETMRNICIRIPGSMRWWR